MNKIEVAFAVTAVVLATANDALRTATRAAHGKRVDEVDAASACAYLLGRYGQGVIDCAHGRKARLQAIALAREVAARFGWTETALLAVTPTAWRAALDWGLLPSNLVGAGVAADLRAAA